MGMDDPRFYLFIGDENSWRISLEENIWGFKEKGQSFGSWNRTKIGDFGAFYVTSPIKKIIGFGKIVDKFKDSKLIWFEEKIAEKAIYSNRLRFKTIFLIDDWKKGIDPPKNMMLNQGRKVLDKKVFQMLVKEAEKSWGENFSKNIF